MSYPKNSSDPLESVMSELGAAQGYKCSKTASTRSTSKRKRLLPELEDYPKNSHVVGSSSVWNPYVRCESLPSSDFLPVLPTNSQMEVIRRRAYERFKRDFYELLERLQETLSIKLAIPSILEKWQMDCKLEEFEEALKLTKYPTNVHTTVTSSIEIRRLFLEQTGWIDPILLSRSASSSFPQVLKLEYKRCWRDQKKDGNEQELQQSLVKLTRKVKQTKKAVHKFICNALEYLEEQIMSKMLLQSTHKRPKLKHDVDRDQVTVTHFGLSFRVHLDHFEKLQRLFDRAATADSATDVCFEEALFCLLCRYDMLQGAGLQAAIPGSVHDVLLQHVDCRMECFASPLNCRTQNFCSAFDLDRLFGSVGSFFTCRFETGCYQANPPFCDNIIAHMCECVNSLLEQQQEPLMFVIFVPVWKDTMGYQLLLKSKHLTKRIVFGQGRHYYAEGSQYRRKESFRAASFDTSVFFYQNEEAQRKWPVSESLLHDLHHAFTTDPRTASGARLKTVDHKPSISAPVKQTGRESVQVASNVTTEASLRPDLVNPTKAKRKLRLGKGKKRTWTGKEEGSAQLAILKSLGLVKNKDADDTTKVPVKKKATRNQKRRSK